METYHRFLSKTNDRPKPDPAGSVKQAFNFESVPPESVPPESVPPEPVKNRHPPAPHRSASLKNIKKNRAKPLKKAANTGSSAS